MTWLIPPVLVAIVAVVMIALHRVAPVGQVLPDPLNYAVGLPIMLAGLALTLSASRRFRRVETEIHTFRRPGRLVSDGPFAFSRNPMYLGFAVALLGFAVKLNALSTLPLVLAFVLAAQFWYIPFEERTAARVFGEEYQAYKNRTRRWF
ncbi:MAG: isoprenylcysteine carboxylmethyltransferase family protein [Rhizobiaceae bacterium]|nr:isoprenylcysteine carboxylmethyltransferase family protein [Rhizobiaceae bacterium]MCV0407664.1 isoprenylcysteine carboxylmethyltransferase family protein [Rhizobiaceae bacterium]